jgi:hypothetical protein
MTVRRSLWVVAILPFFLASCAGSLSVGSEPAISSTASAGSPEPAGPILEILDPQPGETIKLPAEISYQVAGIELPQGARVRIIVENLPTFDIPILAESGTFVLPDDKAAFLPGFRDITFELISADGTRLAPPVTVEDLTIEGRRGG